MSVKDTIAFDQSQSVAGEPNIFLKKDWLKINDSNTSYSSHQSSINTSQVASSKYVNFAESYLDIPLLLTMTGTALAPQTAGTSCDFSLAMKNYFHNVIHSYSVSINGNTVIQATPFSNLWNTFRLTSALSFNEVKTLSHIGFYPDDSSAFAFTNVASVHGIGTTNNRNGVSAPVVAGAFSSLTTQNEGVLKRQLAVAYNATGLTDPAGLAFSSLLTQTSAIEAYKSHIFNRQATIFQQAISAQVRLKDLCPMFDAMPLVKGMFVEIILNYNQTAFDVVTSAANLMTSTDANIISPMGGVNPLMVCSRLAGNGSAGCFTDGNTYRCSLSIGNKVTDTTQANIAGVQNSGMSQQVSLHLASYTLAPKHEASLISQPVKDVVFRDIQYYTIKNVASGSTFDQLLTNGTRGLKSLLVIPLHTSAANSGLTPIFSPFDTLEPSPLALIGQFNVRVAGNNVLSNATTYTYEAFIENLYGCRSLNGGLSTGLGSGLISKADFENRPYYYVDIGRMPDIDANVAKSVAVVGKNMSVLACDYICFVEYERSFQVDILQGTVVE